ncbi:MAG: tetratricopeptide repeat protein [Treponema sp.]|nr:tetratricopeptide repeat protein [Treponema sp.]
MMSRNTPYTSIDLPEKEAPPFEPPAREAAPLNAAGLPSDFFNDLPDDNGAPESADTVADVGAGNFDFSAFLGSVPTDTPPPPEADIPDTSLDDGFSDTAPPADDGSPSDDLSSSADFSSAEETPSSDDFLNPLGNDVPSPDVTSPDFTPPDTLSTDDFLNSLDSGDQTGDSFPADDFLASLNSEPPADSTSEETTPSADDFSVPADLLSGLSDEIESAPADFPPEEPTSADFPAEDFTPEVFSPEEPTSENDEEEMFDLGGERQDGSLSTDSIPEPSNPDKAESAPEIETPSDGFGLPDSFGADSETPSADFALPDDLVPGTETPSDDFALPDSFGTDSETPSADFALPDDLVPDSGTPSADFALPDDLVPDSETPSADFALPDDLVPDSETPSADFGLPDSEEEINLGGESIDEGSGKKADSLDDLGFGTGDSMPDIGLPSIDIDTTEPLGAPAADSSAVLNMADFGEEFASESIELENEPSSETESGAPSASATFSDDDFNLPGLEDIFEKTKTPTILPPPSKKSFFKKKKVAVEEEENTLEDSDEIRLSQSDLDKLLATLAKYPLNLRVACEELIAEQVILPQQLSKLLRMLIRGANVKEMAEFAGQILGKEIIIPRGYEKSTGAEWEEEKNSFAYIFVNNFLPVLKIFAFAGALLVSTGFLCYKFIYIPLKAESLYKRGYERISAGEYQWANELFHDAFVLHHKKKWFYSYAEGFRDQRRYMLAENKYDELLRYYPRDKKGVLDYANLETYYLFNYEKANALLQHELLDYEPNDFDGLLASGDNFLAWADSDPSKFYGKYEDARFAYARILQTYGWMGPVLERMMIYFIHTDNLKETLTMRAWFENNKKKYKLSTPSLAELGGYLLDKQLEKVKGVRDAYVESIESVRDMLLQAVKEDPFLPEPHYHLARYYNNLGNVHEERLTLENAIRAYDLAKKESVRRRLNRVDTHYRYANLLVNNREFFPAEEQLVRGIELYEEFVSRNLIAPSPQLGQLYAGLGDLEYFVKSGNMQAALNNYQAAEKYGWSPPEIQYRMGAAYYQQENWKNALDYLFRAASELPLNRRILFALGNAAYKRGDYFAAQGYYTRLLDILENQRVRLPVLLPNDNPQFLELGERLMMARNNAGVVYEALAKQAGKREYRSRALALYADSARAWDSITRNPQSMTRMTIGNTPGAPSINLGYLNANNALHPSSSFTPEIFIRIDKDVLEPSRWEELAPFGGLID